MTGRRSPRNLLIDDLRFGPMANFMRGWSEWQRDAVVKAVADDLLGSGWIAEERQQPRCLDCRDCRCQGVTAPAQPDLDPQVNESARTPS